MKSNNSCSHYVDYYQHLNSPLQFLNVSYVTFRRICINVNEAIPGDHSLYFHALQTC